MLIWIKQKLMYVYKNQANVRNLRVKKYIAFDGKGIFVSFLSEFKESNNLKNKRGGLRWGGEASWNILCSCKGLNANQLRTGTEKIKER